MRNEIKLSSPVKRRKRKKNTKAAPVATMKFPQQDQNCFKNIVMRNEVKLSSPVKRTRRRNNTTAPVASLKLPLEDDHYCKTIFSAMNVMPSDKKRELKSKLYNIVMDEVKKYD